MTIEIVPYNEEYPLRFKDVERFVRKITAFQMGVEHVGSTAVPDLGGKDVIDVLVVVGRREKMMEIIQSLENEWYEFDSRHGRGVFPDRYFISGDFPPGGEAFHVHFHVTFSGSSEEEEKLLFRDYLRENNNEAGIYFKKKQAWRIEAKDGLIQYSKLKSEYIQQVLEKARAKRS